jgi:leucyl-tRNA synthetase
MLLLAPSAPHLAEELWERTGNAYSIHNQHWPEWDAELAAEEEITLVVQVNGKVRDRVLVPVDVDEERAKAAALSSEKVTAHLAQRRIERIIYVPERLVNIVVK